MKQIPHNEDAEKTIVASVLRDNSVMAGATAALSAADFYSARHRMIYEAELSLFNRGRAIDEVTLKEELSRTGSLDAVGSEYINTLTDGLPRYDNVDPWTEIVRDKAAMRRLLDAGERIMKMATGGGTADEALDLAQKAILDVADATQSDGGFHSPASSVKETLRAIDEESQSWDGITGLRTGIREYDDKTSGMKPGQLIVVAGRPGMGKSAFVSTVGDELVADGKKVALFSLEMSHIEVMKRRFAKRADQPMRFIKSSDKAFDSVAKASIKMSKDQLYVDDSSGLSLSQIRSKARRLHHEKGGLDLIMVDHIGLMTPESTNLRASEYEITTMACKGLKRLAKELGLPVIAFSQLNRELEKRTDKRPVLSDLRSSGEVEQSADLIVFLYRPNYYDSTADRTLAEWIISKQRNGPTGTVRVDFIQEITTFRERKEAA